MKKAKLYPYHCLYTEQELELQEPVTALVGRNEAGKTSVLELLARSNYYDENSAFAHFVDRRDYPRRMQRDLEQMEKPPIATALTYEVTGDLLEQIVNDMVLLPQTVQFTRVTNYAGAHQVISNGFDYDLHDFWEAYASRKEPELMPLRRSLAGVHTREEFRWLCERAGESQGPSREGALKRIEKFFDNPHGWENPINEYVFRVYLLPNIPRFLYYDACAMLPERIRLESLLKEDHTPENQTCKAFLALVGLDIQTLTQAEDLSDERRKLEMVQAELSEDFLQAWTGNANLRIELSLDRQVVRPGKKGGLFRRAVPPVYETGLNIRIKDVKSMVSLPITSRSKGFQWFFSFWIWFKAVHDTEKAPLIFLLDEPGLHLHEDAQKDMLTFIRRLSETYQILYTTHSPFLLEEGDQHVYQLINEENGTEINAWNCP